MDATPRDRSSSEVGERQLGSLEGKVIGAVQPTEVSDVTTALEAAGYSTDEIDVVTSEDIAALDVPIDRPGLSGLVSRFVFSIGDDLDEIQQAREELAAGLILIGVAADGDESVHRVRDILREHGGQSIVHFGRWTITTFE
jgi:hypothetical protein